MGGRATIKGSLVSRGAEQPFRCLDYLRVWRLSVNRREVNMGPKSRGINLALHEVSNIIIPCDFVGLALLESTEIAKPKNKTCQ